MDAKKLRESSGSLGVMVTRSTEKSDPVWVHSCMMLDRESARIKRQLRVMSREELKILNNNYLSY